MAGWYARLADVPRIQFQGSPGVDRARLPEANVRPTSGYAGTLMWPHPDGTTSASPAHQRAFTDAAPDDVEGLAQWVWEGLEIPGTPSDYHFLLQGAVQTLWSWRRDQPDGLQFVEVFSYVDLALIEAVPEAAMIDAANPSRGFLRIVTMERLLVLLEREGAFREAMALCRRVERFGEQYCSDGLASKIDSLDRERL
ncbi:hypothetical protein DMA12_42475 [Amycolatopsis balhimycina DSM 5908]|uniref:Uncharacterized protein n=1 Tax=Amycolatopsis balhimycina DSM 5908 TaxID=1081091 RepID=A0A428VYJ6_AMYBA|nr:hypothetical protein [Amycolatopsis balhimycina]RSM35893.1 hypothetical protein DMA12_42475 [Amycolatopsis balhimycina DSM 5908]